MKKYFVIINQHIFRPVASNLAVAVRRAINDYPSQHLPRDRILIEVDLTRTEDIGTIARPRRTPGFPPEGRQISGRSKINTDKRLGGE